MLALKSNLSQSRSYLRINIFSNKDLMYKDHGICNSWKIKEDIYVEQISNFTINKDTVNAEVNDIVYVVDSENKLVYLGLVDTIENDNIKVPIAKINTKPIISIFDLSIFLKEFNGDPLGSAIRDLINESFLINENFFDSKDNKEYLEVEVDPCISTLTGKLEIKENEELSLLKFFKTIYDMFEVYLMFDLDLTKDTPKLKVLITKKKFCPGAISNYSLRDDFADISNVKLSNLYSQTVNRLDYYSIDDYKIKDQYFLLKDNSVKAKLDLKPEHERIYPVVIKAVLSKNVQIPIKEYAEQELRGNIYSHLIQFDILTSTKIIDLNQLNLRDKITIYVNNVAYQSVLSAYEYQDNKSILSLSLGKSRLLLTDRLKLGNY